MSEEDKKSTLKACLEESNNDRMKNYVKILDEPGITTFEWIHRTQEELMDGIVYLEKLKDMLAMNMRELDAARMESIKRNEKKDETTNTEELPIKEIIEEPEVKVETKTIKKRKVKVKAVNTSKD
tara:strand:- start:5734 stop:6108 length:375 start_codon:yes stop_codon:yes gene_type:complete